MFKGVRSFKSLQFKLLGIFFLLSLVPAFLIINVILDTTINFFVEQQKIVYMQEVNIVSNNIEQEKYLTDEYRAKYLNQYVLNRSSSSQYRLFVIDKKGKIISDSSETATGKTYINTEIIKALQGEDVINYYEEDNTLYVSSPIISTVGNELLGVVLIVSSVDKIPQLSLEIKNNIDTISIIIVAVFLVFAYFIIRILLNPLNNIMEVIEKMSKGNFDAQIKLKSNSDFYSLAEAINEMSNKIDSIEKSRDQFVSNVSHELKTPLSSIKVLGDSLLLQEDVPKEMYVEFLEDIVSETDRLTLIVNDLLTLVKIDQSNIVLNIEEVAIGNLVEKIIKRIQYIADRKNIEMSFVMEKEFNVEVDPIKIDLAIVNLIDNAVKYTRENGKVKVKVVKDNSYVYIIVEDSGIGISKEDLPNIFKRFYRVDKTRDRETGGFGLGLAITYSTVILHNGDVKVTSELGVGTKFIIMLPLKYSREV